MNTLDAVYVGLIAFASAMVVIGLVYRRKPTPRPETVRDLRAWKLNVTPFPQNFGGGRKWGA